MQFIDDKTWEALKTRDLHFCHLNINSLLSKIDELRDITNYINSASQASQNQKAPLRTLK